MKRKEKSAYKPSDLWTTEDDLLYLKYCKNKRDRCFHALAIETSCRPHEILSLKIKDIVFKHSEEKQYAEILVNGKTGPRVIPLFYSLPYVKDWILDHPQSTNRNAILICGLAKNLGRRLSRYAIYDIYQHYREKVFPTLLSDPNVSLDDKHKIRNLLNKPWNPYIHRHSALTKKAQILKEHCLRQHAGWTASSMMPQVYLHFYGNESSKSLLEAYGLVATDQVNATSLMKPKQCPNCNESNKPDSKFCAHCRMVLTYDAYNETLEEQKRREDKLTAMEGRFNTMESQMLEVLTVLNMVKRQDGLIRKDRTVLDDKRRITFGYIGDNNELVHVKIPIDSVEIK
ncbi:MAG TPA: site-specific integrase [Nitrososphaeraceae archaeon]